METLSVIIPVYNSSAYLADCVASVTAVNVLCTQPWVLEIILVDDGSTDGSSELCDRLARSAGAPGPRIRVIHQPNQGVSAARNAGLRAAEGSFLLFIDSDDFLDAPKMAALLEALRAEPSADLVMFGLSFDYYSGGRIYRQDLKLPPFQGTKSSAECSAELGLLFQTNMLSPLWNKLIRRSVLRDGTLSLREDMFLYEDLEFSLRVLARCETVLFWREAIYRYRQPPDEGNAGRRLKRIPHIPVLVKRIEDALTPFGDPGGILLSLYLILARERVGCASRAEVQVVCADFAAWVDARRLRSKIQNSKYAMLLYQQRCTLLLIRREKTKLRHRAANLLKKTFGDFRSGDTGNR